MVIQLGLTRLKKRQGPVSPLLDLLEGRAEKGRCDLMCGAPVDDWANASLC